MQRQRRKFGAVSALGLAVKLIRSTPRVGIIIGALARGMYFLAFGLMRAVHTRGFSTVVVLSTLKGRSIGQSPFVRMTVAAGIRLRIVLRVAVAMVLGGTIGGAIEYALTEMA
jgi:hypothetical protein